MAKVTDKVEVKEADDTFTGKMLVGMDVYWFKGGGKVEPKPAKVARAYDNGQCDLIVFEGSGTYTYDSVHHLSHPSLKDHYGQASENARRYGAWDFTPWTKDDYAMYVGK
jgi:hypothetical protein